ncbi:MAG: enoyl-CoA hydratase-related protein [Granulosicoccus sp.]
MVSLTRGVPAVTMAIHFQSNPLYLMKYQTIEASVTGSTGVLTLNRPSAMNALNRQMMTEVKEVILAWDESPDVRVIVMTGNEKAFAAGADIKEMHDVEFLDAVQQHFLDDWTCISDCRTPTIAAVAGYALGGGCEIAMMCDFIIAADNARFGQPEIRIGTIPGLGGTQRLARRVGSAKAMDMCLTGRMMDAREAESSGLVARVVPVDQLQAQAMEAAGTIASYSATAVQLARDAVNAASSTTLEQGLHLERQSFYALFGTPDQKEGMGAFMNKREPKFSR